MSARNEGRVSLYAEGVRTDEKVSAARAIIDLAKPPIVKSEPKRVRRMRVRLTEHGRSSTRPTPAIRLTKYARPGRFRG